VPTQPRIFFNDPDTPTHVPHADPLEDDGEDEEAADYEDD